MSYLGSFFYAASWADLIEVSIIWCLLYALISFLNTETTRPIFQKMCTYCAVFIISILCNFASLETMLWYTLPAVSALFLLWYRDTINKEIIVQEESLKSLPIGSLTEQLMRLTLQLRARNQGIVIIILRHDVSNNSPESVPRILMQVPFDMQFILKLCTAISLERERIIWIQPPTKLIGIGPTCNTNNTIHISNSAQPLFELYRTNILPDNACILYSSPDAARYHIAWNKIGAQTVTMPEAEILLKQYLSSQPALSHEKKFHEQENF